MSIDLNNTGIGIADGSITPAKLSQPFTQGTSVATTSGTFVDFTGIPSWVKRITVMFNGVSLSGTANILTQIGDSGGIETSGYNGTVGVTDSTSPTYGAQALSTGVLIVYIGSATNTTSGSLVFTLIGSNTWSFFGNGSCSAAIRCGFCAGSKSLTDTLDRVRITTTNGTDTFDAGSVNITWE